MTGRRRILASLAAGLGPWRPGRAAAPKRPIVPRLAPPPEGGPPFGFSILKTGGGGLPNWESIPDPDYPGTFVLAQRSDDPTEYRLPLAIYNSFSAADVDVSVRFKLVSGTIDQAGGIAIRLADADNYYVARASAAENNLTFYRIVNGHRHDIAGADAAVALPVWHTIGIRAEGNRFALSFDGKTLFNATESTFARAGNVALWTAADSVVWFSALSMQALG
jgi:hypothetical protein